MNVLWYLIPISIALGAIGLVAFFWSLRTGQYDDLEGAAQRILFDDDDRPGGPEAAAGDSLRTEGEPRAGRAANALD